MSLIKPSRYGIIVFDQDLTILVKTCHGIFSFPKGKRKKRESDLETAWRELEEETGLTSENVELLDNFYINERNSKGGVATRYFVGYIKKSATRISFNPNELAGVTWFNIRDALKLEKLKITRKNILAIAHNKFINYTLIK